MLTHHTWYCEYICYFISYLCAFLQTNLLQGPKQQIRTNERNENNTSEGFILKSCH